MIEFRGVSKTYPGSSSPVVNNLSFEICNGEICVLVGPSGSDVLEEHPEIEGILGSVTESLDVDTIRELNGRVDIDQEDPEDVARQHLDENGLV